MRAATIQHPARAIVLSALVAARLVALNGAMRIDSTSPAPLSPEALILDDKIVGSPTPAFTVTGVARFFDLDQRHFQREPRMGKDTREVDQFVKQIEQRCLLGTEPSP